MLVTGSPFYPFASDALSSAFRRIEIWRDAGFDDGRALEYDVLKQETAPRINPEEIVKSLRIAALLLAVSTFPTFAMPAHAQQEVDPDHFDQAPSVRATAHSSKVAARRRHNSTRMASRHAGSKVNRHVPRNAIG